MDSHDRAVKGIAAKIRKFHARQEPFRIYHGSTNSTRPSQYRRSSMVDTSGLLNVLKVDTGSKTALVEPNVPMDSLVEATLQHGLLPPVVMEFQASQLAEALLVRPERVRLSDMDFSTGLSIGSR
jgi:FAD/FMN-containing dehydrogenase